ncbi:MAG: permease-like cell division protein FtsX [Myxococcota bacterium]
MLRRLAYFVSKALASVRGSPGISFVTAATIGAALVVVGLYVMALQNLEGLALVWGRTATLIAYVDDAVPVTEHGALRRRVEAIESVGKATVITPALALERFSARGPEAAALVAGVNQDVLPTTIEVGLRCGFADLEAMKKLALHIVSIGGIAEVDYGQLEFERLQALLDLLRYGGIAAGLLIGLATAFIVSNTIRLTVYARRDEIAILQLVGATRWFVRTPFLFEGVLWGVAGGFMSAAMLWVGDAVLAPRISVAIADVVGGLDIHLFTIPVAAMLVGGGAVLGILGSALAVGRFLDVEST